MNHGSLFSGIGGFDLGLERAGIKTIWQVEINPFCRKVLAKHFPEAKRYEDIKTVGAHNLERPNILTGGFPCQDISQAGKRAGIDGDRSGLWREYFRLIGELRPDFAIVENVSALLVPNSGGPAAISRVLGDLAQIGYDAEWDSIRASDLGAPHRRERIWIVAYPGRNDGGTRQRTLPVSEIPNGARRPDTDMADADGQPGTARREQPMEGQPLLPARLGERSKTLADADGTGCGVQPPHGTPQCNREDVGNAGDSNQDVSYTDGGRREQRDARKWRFPIFDPNRRLEQFDQWAVEPNVGRVANGIPARVDRLTGLGNAIVPQIAELIAKRILELEAQ